MSNMPSSTKAPPPTTPGPAPVPGVLAPRTAPLGFVDGLGVAEWLVFGVGDAPLEGFVDGVGKGDELGEGLGDELGEELGDELGEGLGDELGEGVARVTHSKLDSTKKSP